MSEFPATDMIVVGISYYEGIDECDSTQEYLVELKSKEGQIPDWGQVRILIRPDRLHMYPLGSKVSVRVVPTGADELAKQLEHYRLMDSLTRLDPKPRPVVESANQLEKLAIAIVKKLAYPVTEG